MEGTSSEPTFMPLDLLQKITNGFSEERELGSGSFGTVYLGIHPNGEKIAVKVLKTFLGEDHKQFLNEFHNLLGLKHNNIVRLVGHCYDIKEEPAMYGERMVIADRIHRVICLEYMSNGSLENYLSEINPEKCGRYDWHTCYQIIKGICQGLKYLHNSIYHLDLKPANILLDENMVPRIADFGISRLFSSKHTWATKSDLATIGYTPPEFFREGLISNKYDIFSLGVIIIKMMAGRQGYFNRAEMSSQQFSNHVQENWTNKLLETSNRTNAYSEQVKTCIEIGLCSVQEDRCYRPTIQKIVSWLEQTETEGSYAPTNDRPFIFQGANGESLYQYAQDPNDRCTHHRFIEEFATLRVNGVPTNEPLHVHLLPGLAEFRIVGEHRLGSTLRVNGVPTNGTTCAKYEWFRFATNDNHRQHIEGATGNSYVATANDVDSLISVEITPMDADGRQGFLLRAYSANNIICDPNMQYFINYYISMGEARFGVFVLEFPAVEWRYAELLFTQTTYRIVSDEIKIEQKYSPDLEAIIPDRLIAMFSLNVKVDSVIRELHFRTGITEPNSSENEFRLRDIIVIVMRAFQKKALLDPRRPAWHVVKEEIE